MPYITKEDRERLLKGGSTENPGDLAYLMYCLMVDWVYREGPGLSYSRAAHAIGIIDSVKNEFYNSHLNGYELYKKEENGSISIKESQAVAKRLTNHRPEDQGNPPAKTRTTLEHPWR